MDRDDPMAVRDPYLYLAAAIVVTVLLAVILVGPAPGGEQLGLIPTLIAIAGKKFFGKKEDDSDGLGKHPAVAYVFRALTTGEMDDLGAMVADDFHAYANGLEMVGADDADGPGLFRENIELWRATVPNLEVDLYDEVSQKDPDKTDSIAVRYVVSGSLPCGDESSSFTVEAAAFVKVVDHEIEEWRVVVDQTFLEQLHVAMGRPIGE